MKTFTHHVSTLDTLSPHASLFDPLSHHMSPLDQFEIRNMLSVDAPILADMSLSLTNIGLYLTIGGCFLFILNLMSTNNKKIISNT